MKLRELVENISFEISFKYGEVTGNIRDFFRSIQRFCYWGWKMRVDRNWDHYFFYRTMWLKLTDMHRAAERDTDMRWTSDPTSDEYINWKALSVAVSLSERIMKDDYSTKMHDRLEKKYGELTIDNKPIERLEGVGGLLEGAVQIVFLRDGIPTAEREDYDEYNNSVLDGMKMANSIRERDKTWLFNIIKKYSDAWWT
jgi:hypothetical protein